MSSQLFILEQGKQEVCNLVETLEDCVFNGLEPYLVNVIGVGSLVQKKFNHVNMIFFNRRDQWSLSSRGWQIWISFIFLYENVGQLQIASQCSLAQSRNFRNCSQWIFNEVRSFGKNFLNHIDVFGVDVIVQIFVVCVHVGNRFGCSHSQ